MRAAAVLALAALVAAAPPLAAQEAKAPPSPREARMAAYDRGLAWLRSQQDDKTFGLENGTFGVMGKSDPGLTGLALVAFLRRPGGLDPRDRALVDKGLAYLVSLQKPDGGIYVDQLATYNTSIAVQAMVASGREDLKGVVEKATAFLKRAQYGEDGSREGMRVGRADQRYGGMGYGDDPTRPDLSNTQFALDSLRAAGIPESDPAFQRALVYAQRLQNRKENENGPEEPKEWKAEDGSVIVRSNDGGSVYRPGQSKAGTFARPDGKLELRSYGSMTYALLKCYLFAGLPKDDPRVVDALKWIRANYSWKENPGFADGAEGSGQQALYYYYATAARALSLLGDDAAGAGPDGKPRLWKDDLAGTLLAAQRADGSWINENDRFMEGLPIIPTCMALQALAEILGGGDGK